MKKKNERKLSLKSSILLLLLTAILLVSSSYAWFTSNQTVTVSSLDVNVVAKNGLQISVDGTNWKAVIAKTDILGAVDTYEDAVNQVPSVLEPVSSAGTVDTTTGFMKLFYGTVGTEGGNYVLTAARSTETNANAEGKFIAFDLFFKVDADTPVFLNPSSNVIYTGDSDKGLQNAARVAFLTEGHAAPGTAVATIQGLSGATDATTRIWEPNYDVHQPAAISNANDTYGITTTATGGSLLAYNGIKADITTGVALNSADTNYFAAVTPAYSTTAAFPTKIAFTTLVAGVTKVRVYMWLEGQDVDCQNSASGTNIQYNLEITSVAT